jgi:fructose-bisphosphate aldolase, class II
MIRLQPAARPVFPREQGVSQRSYRNSIGNCRRAPGAAAKIALLIRPDEASTPVRAEPVEAQVARVTLRQAQGERFRLQRAGSIVPALGPLALRATIADPALQLQPTGESMPLVSMRQLLDHAAENGYGIPAYNVNNLEQVQAVMAAANEVGSPVILQASAGARKYAGEAFIKHLISAAIETYPHIPLVMHQDHGQSPDVCKGAIDLGFSSVMMDGSLRADGKTIASFDYNVDVTRKVVDMAHALGVTVEGELGCLGSLETMKGDKEDGHGTEATMTMDQLLTDPEEAAEFVKRTQLDALAIAIGTSHGAYKFTRKPTGDILAISRIKEIHRRIPNTHLVMHGSSSVPQEFLAEIRKYGGNMKETYGVPVSEIQEAIKHGVRKINIDTDIRLAMTAAIRKFFVENPEKFDPRDYLKPAREAAKAVCKQRYLEFNCEGQAAKIKPQTLVQVSQRYAKGELAQTVN